MTVLLIWLALLLLFAGGTWLGARLGLLPIVSQLLLAMLGLPLLVLGWIEPHGQIAASQLVEPHWLKSLYGLSFALLLGYILSDVVDLRLSPESLKIALPSFFVPFFCGLACALWLLPPLPWLSAVSIGLLFSITAIPVLYLYLQGIGYDPAATRRLMHSAILMDLMCWSLFALTQGSANPQNLIWPLLAAALPLLLKTLRLRNGLAYSLPFFALMLLFQQLQMNALIFGIGYLLCLAWLRQPFVLPLSATVLRRVQNGFAIPLILSYGILQIDFRQAVSGYSWFYLGALLALPVLAKLAGNWIGLGWAEPGLPLALRWRESLLLNIRGLTEIVFLNLLFQQHLLDSLLYFSLMLMSLFSTLLPALLGIRRPYPMPSLKRNSHGNL